MYIYHDYQTWIRLLTSSCLYVTGHVEVLYTLKILCKSAVELLIAVSPFTGDIDSTEEPGKVNFY
jgi:hypothetical protein